MSEPLFKGLVSDEYDQPVGSAKVGDEPCYVINDNGFLLHIPSKPIDMEILKAFTNQIEGNESMLAQQAAEMVGQDDLFTHAAFESTFRNVDKHLDAVLEHGLPEDALAYMGMMGFHIVLDMHGEILRIQFPAAAANGGEGNGDE